MRLRLTGGLVALVALLAVTVPALAQDDPSERSKGVKKVYRDYRDDGVIDACDHTKRALKKTLDGLPPEADIETPDLRPALEAGIEQIEDDNCAEKPEETPTPTQTPSPTPAPTTTPAPDTGDSSGSAGPAPGGDDGGRGANPPGADDVSPLDPEVTPVPPAVTPSPAAPPPAEPSGPVATPAPVFVNADDAVPVSLLVLAGLLALLALLALLYAAVSRLGWGERRLAGVRRAWREAAFRAGGTWGDFADWLRLGR